jgi:hypothetical protein
MSLGFWENETTHNCKVMRATLLTFFILPFLVQVQADCLQEFDKCVTNRDCCGDLQCRLGDWSLTTDSTCLSDRSMEMNSKALEQQVALVQRYYQRVAHGKKSLNEIETLTRKYSMKGEFARLVIRLERMYGIRVDFEDVNEHNEF